MPGPERTLKRVLMPVTGPTVRRTLIVGRDAAVGGVAAVRALRPSGATPGFLVIGAQKAGTTFLHQELVRHPDVVPPLTKEIHYFDDHYARGADWYGGHFRSGPPGSTTGEASPGYLFHPHAVGRLARDLPEARAVVLLRDPVRRAWSHFQHERRLGFETEQDFGRALDLEESRTATERTRMWEDPDHVSHAVRHFSYRARGEYLDQVERARAALADRLLVIVSERLFSDTRTVLDEVQRFLGLAPWQPASLGPNDMAAGHSRLDPAVARDLRSHYAPHVDVLSDRLGIDLRGEHGWLT